MRHILISVSMSHTLFEFPFSYILSDLLIFFVYTENKEMTKDLSLHGKMIVFTTRYDLFLRSAIVIIAIMPLKCNEIAVNSCINKSFLCKIAVNFIFTTEYTKKKCDIILELKNKKKIIKIPLTYVDLY